MHVPKHTHSMYRNSTKATMKIYSRHLTSLNLSFLIYIMEIILADFVKGLLILGTIAVLPGVLKHVIKWKV